MCSRFSIEVPEFYNFGFDVIDAWAKRDRNKLAMIWVDQNGEEKNYSYQDLANPSNQATKILLKYGINKGDQVLVMLPRIQEWWIFAIALIMLGAVFAPCPMMLTSRDIKYRVNKGKFREYLNNPEENKKSFVGDYFYTGDKAYRDEDGYLWFIGWDDDVIKSYGYRIGPFEVESALNEHPAVQEAAVVGSPYDIRGLVVKAFVILKHDIQPSETLAREIQNYVKKVTAPYKYPRSIKFVPSLPKTISGKIRRKELHGQEMHKGSNDTSASKNA